MNNKSTGITSSLVLYSNEFSATILKSFCNEKVCVHHMAYKSGITDIFDRGSINIRFVLNYRIIGAN